MATGASRPTRASGTNGRAGEADNYLKRMPEQTKTYLDDRVVASAACRGACGTR